MYYLYLNYKKVFVLFKLVFFSNSYVHSPLNAIFTIRLQDLISAMKHVHLVTTEKDAQTSAPARMELLASQRPVNVFAPKVKGNYSGTARYASAHGWKARVPPVTAYNGF